MKGKWLVVRLGVVVVLSLATMPGCGPIGIPISQFLPFHFDSFGHLVGNLQCQDPHVTVLRGQSNCKIDSAGNLECELKNPCPRAPGFPIDGNWGFSDEAFVTGDCNNVPLAGPVNGVTSVEAFPQRFLVADLTAQPKVDFPVCYIYQTSGDFGALGAGTGILFVTTAATLTVSATAKPTTVAFGDTSQLNATVTGGVPPFSFAWSPPASLSDPTLANPVAKLSMTTTYTVVVTDSVPNTASATTTVTVGSPSGFKVGVQIPFDTPDGQVSVTVGTNVCLATNVITCTQLVPGGTQVLLKVVKFPAHTTKLFDWNNVTCDINRTPTSCTFTVTKDTSVVPVFL